MLTELQQLEQTIAEIKTRYHITATELANLKHKVANDDRDRQISDLMQKLERSQQENQTLNTRVQELSDSRHALEGQIETLYEQNQQLLAQNDELAKKNALAISRAEVIQEWLTKIDNQHV